MPSRRIIGRIVIIRNLIFMLSLKSYPKINLALDILKKDASGYHEIQTIFHMLPEPFDELIIEELAEDKIKIGCDNPALPLDDTNTVLKAAKLLKRQAGVKGGAKIFLKKKIPLMSGLGGGSSNAVVALKGLARLWAIRCCADGSHKDSQCLLRKIAAQIGMDCAFFFYGGTALGEHFGEKITPLPALPSSIKFEIIETGIEISSHWAYRQINLQQCAKNLDKTKKLIAAIRAGGNKEILENIHNDFEEFVFAAPAWGRHSPWLAKHPKLREIKKRELQKNPQNKIILCGSGGALFILSNRLNH